MRRPRLRLRLRLRTMMLLVAAIAVLAWLARSQDGRITLVFAGLVSFGFAAGNVLSKGIERIGDFPLDRLRHR